MSKTIRNIIQCTARATETLGASFKRYIKGIPHKGKRIKKIAGTTAFIIAVVVYIFIIIPEIHTLSHLIIFNKGHVVNPDSILVQELAKKLQNENMKLRKKLDLLTPGTGYLIINTSDNTFRLINKRELVREGICSTGSYIELETEDSVKYVFKTPKGMFRIQGKTTSPVWRKPDWAFVEEGLPVPSANHPSRYEYGVLGEYALSLGDGYLIHGTLYKRFLGMPVTHGCVRMNDEDLEDVYRTLQIGSKVYIY